MAALQRTANPSSDQRLALLLYISSWLTLRSPHILLGLTALRSSCSCLGHNEAAEKKKGGEEYINAGSDMGTLG